MIRLEYYCKVFDINIYIFHINYRVKNCIPKYCEDPLVYISDDIMIGNISSLYNIINIHAIRVWCVVTLMP